MFKYYISAAFLYFTQYYQTSQKCYESPLVLRENQTFLCALYKKGEVEDEARYLFNLTFV